MTRHSRPTYAAVNVPIPAANVVSVHGVTADGTPCALYTTRQTLRTRRARLRLLRAASDFLHEQIANLPAGAAAIRIWTNEVSLRLIEVGIDMDASDLLDYYDARRVYADVVEGVYPGTEREAAVARIDAYEQIAWHESNVGGE